MDPQALGVYTPRVHTSALVFLRVPILKDVGRGGSEGSSDPPPPTPHPFFFFLGGGGGGRGSFFIKRDINVTRIILLLFRNETLKDAPPFQNPTYGPGITASLTWPWMITVFPKLLDQVIAKWSMAVFTYSSSTHLIKSPHRASSAQTNS